VTTADPRRALVERHVGVGVTRVERLRYADDGGPTPADGADEGDLQLGFADGSVLHFRVAGDGEQLEIGEEAYRDLFAPPLSPENEAFVKRSGAWRLVDVSGEPGYRDWIGKALARASITRSSATLTTSDGATMQVVVDRDELEVRHARVV
jgi:hypothetical protein